ncbi:hypothetical protein HGA91_00600 [candidate division WWE3 bacterium]|nr:hypothetical protein [candidate division WWE3 bacterium]
MPNRDLNGLFFSIAFNDAAFAGHIHGCCFESSGRTVDAKIGVPREDGLYDYTPLSQTETDTPFDTGIKGAILIDRKGGHDPRGVVVAASVIAEALITKRLSPRPFAGAIERDGYIQIRVTFDLDVLVVRIYPDHHPLMLGEVPFSERCRWWTTDADWVLIPSPSEEELRKMRY